APRAASPATEDTIHQVSECVRRSLTSALSMSSASKPLPLSGVETLALMAFNSSSETGGRVSKSLPSAVLSRGLGMMRPDPLLDSVFHICDSRCRGRSEEHTSELQSRFDIVCRLLLEKK